MKSIEEQMITIKRRRTYYTIKKQVRTLSATAVVLALLLIGALVYAPGVMGTTNAGGATVYGSTILGPDAGGYVIVAILAFILGIVVTGTIQKAKKMKEYSPDSEK